MPILKILYYPDTRLRIVAKPVKKIDFKIKKILKNMFDTMYYKDGIGLAATQVNIHKQIVVIDVSEERNKALVLMNPKLLSAQGNILIEEGCLSIPEQRASIPRFKEITVAAIDGLGNNFKLKARDLLAVCIQHEMDHLIGKLFTDYLSLIEQKRIYQKLKKKYILYKNTN